jgi:hypothetical protein
MYVGNQDTCWETEIAAQVACLRQIMEDIASDNERLRSKMEVCGWLGRIFGSRAVRVRQT